METITARKTKTLCPECARDLEGTVEEERGTVYLSRCCPEHGAYRFRLSGNGAAYLDFDRFYDELNGCLPRGRIANFWVLSNTECQINCTYCQTEIRRPFYENMTRENFTALLNRKNLPKLSISGGEPALHPSIMDFFRDAAARGITPQIATNGVELADADFCARLVDAGMKEVRISIDSFDRGEADIIGTGAFLERKMRALENLERMGVPTVLAPSIFKGVNEGQVCEALEYASGRPFIRGISVNGFSWVGEGRGMSRDWMIMPDEMMDTIHARYFSGPRDEIYTFQKLIFAALRVLGIRLCLNTQIMFFVRERGKLLPVTEFINMKRAAVAAVHLGGLFQRGRAAGAVSLGMAGIMSMRPSSLRILSAGMSMLLANVFGLNISKYPGRLLPLVMNTNCSTLNFDEAAARQCMSGIYYQQEGCLREWITTEALVEKEKAHRRDESA